MEEPQEKKQGGSTGLLLPSNPSRRFRRYYSPSGYQVDLVPRREFRVSVRGDLDVLPKHDEQGQTYYQLTDPRNSRQYRFNRQDYFLILNMMDAEPHTFEEVKSSFETRFPEVHLHLEHLEGLIDRMWLGGLLESVAPEGEEQGAVHRLPGTETGQFEILAPLARPDEMPHTPPERQPSDDGLSVLKDSVTKLLADLPTDPLERLGMTSKLYTEMRQQVADVIRPAINSLLKESVGMDYDAKRKLCQEINEVLRDARLSLVDPVSKLPAKLQVNRARPSSPSSSLRLQDTRKAGDGKEHYIDVADLDLNAAPIEIVEHIPGPDGAGQPKPGRPSGRGR